jgi:hypothetical protein
MKVAAKRRFHNSGVRKVREFNRMDK